MNSPTTNKCISRDELLNFASGNLSQEQLYLVHEHIKSCELCNSAVQHSKSILESDLKELDIAFSNVLNKRKNMYSTLFLKIAASLAITIALSFLLHSEINKVNNAELPPAVTYNYFINEGTPPSIHTPFKEREVLQLQNAPVHRAQNNQKNDEAFRKNFSYFPIKQQSPSTNSATDIIVSIHEPELSLFADTFVFDLKITDFGKYYNQTPTLEFANHVPANFKNKNDTENVVSKYYYETSYNLLLTALTCFNDNDYINAIKTFGKILANNPNDINARFYTSVAMIKAGHPHNAIAHLEFVLNNSNSSFYDEAKWYKAQALFMANHNNDAKKLLIELVKENSFYKSKAGELLNKIN